MVVRRGDAEVRRLDRIERLVDAARPRAAASSRRWGGRAGFPPDRSPPSTRRASRGPTRVARNRERRTRGPRRLGTSGPAALEADLDAKRDVGRRFLVKVDDPERRGAATRAGAPPSAESSANGAAASPFPSPSGAGRAAFFTFEENSPISRRPDRNRRASSPPASASAPSRRSPPQEARRRDGGKAGFPRGILARTKLCLFAVDGESGTGESRFRRALPRTKTRRRKPPFRRRRRPLRREGLPRGPTDDIAARPGSEGDALPTIKTKAISTSDAPSGFDELDAAIAAGAPTAAPGPAPPRRAGGPARLLEPALLVTLMQRKEDYGPVRASACSRGGATASSSRAAHPRGRRRRGRAARPRHPDRGGALHRPRPGRALPAPAVGHAGAPRDGAPRNWLGGVAA